jgi:secreted trypsin-like serine protease
MAVLNKKWFFSITIVIVIFLLLTFSRKNVSLREISKGTEFCFGQDLELPQPFLVKDPYIIGGVVATKCPWMVKLGQGVLCGGCLISPNWILSASHCGINLGSIAILGAQNFTILEPNQQRIEIKEIIRHPKFGLGPLTTLPNDIMLLKLSRPAKINDHVYPICLPNNWNVAGRNLIVYGWGNTVPSEKINISPNLLQVTVREADQCKYKINSQSQICTTASNSPLQTTCFGDSGGPLVLNEFNKNFVVGLVSWGAQGTCENYTVFTRVSYHIDWIKNVTGLF